MRYENMVGIVDGEFTGFRAQEHAAYPEFFRGEHSYSIEAAVGFMMAACQLPYTQALMWVCRAQVQYVRSGLLDDDGVGPHLPSLRTARLQRTARRMPGSSSAATTSASKRQRAAPSRSCLRSRCARRCVPTTRQ